MKWTYIIALLLVFALAAWLWNGKKSTEAEQATAQKAVHDSFVGSPPAPSKPYNIMDYTKPAATQKQ